jgi:hypothetical protein
MPALRAGWMIRTSAPILPPGKPCSAKPLAGGRNHLNAGIHQECVQGSLIREMRRKLGIHNLTHDQGAVAKAIVERILRSELKGRAWHQNIQNYIGI